MATLTGRLCRSRARFWASAQTRAASAASASASGASSVSDSIRGRRRVVGVGAEKAVEAVGAEDRAGDERPRRRSASSPQSGSSQASEVASSRPASLAARAAATRARSASISSRLPSPTTRAPARAARDAATASFLKPPLASSAPAAPARLSGSDPPSWSPTTSRSASTSAGLALADLDLHGRRVYALAHAAPRRLPVSSRSGPCGPSRAETRHKHEDEKGSRCPAQ